MLIPLIPKKPDLNDFTCRDGEIEFIMLRPSAQDTEETTEEETLDEETLNEENTEAHTNTNNLSLIINNSSLEETIRIPLQSGEKEKAALLLNGDISRVDPETAERLTQAIVQKAAECLLDLSTDLRRRGLFILPFRAYTLTQLPDGSLSYPSPQAVALPADFPPHPEITAAATTDDCLTIVLRFPVRPHRLTVTASADLPPGHSLRTFISYPLYIPDPKEMRGSIGSVRSATGGQATGIRFAFLSTSAIKASVAAPEKYYEIVGNERTGYRVSSKAAAAPDYSCYADTYGYVQPFTRGSLLALGEDADPDTDPMDWIADWRPAIDPTDTAREGYLPAFLPYNYRLPTDGSEGSGCSWPEGIDPDFVGEIADEIEAYSILLTRPMTLANDAVSRRHAEARSIRTLRIAGLPPAAPARAILYGSDDCVRWTPLRSFDPRVRSLVLSPPRLFWRVLLISLTEGSGLAIEAT